MILHHGKILTVDDAFSIQHAIVIRDGRILAIGGDTLVSRYVAARVIDLKGRLALPGFNDTHTHLSGDPARHIVLSDARSIADIIRRTRAMAVKLGPGEWITGYGWSEDQLAERRRPLRRDLDRAAPANPVVFYRAGGHSVVVNGKAFELAHITRATPDPERGVFEHDTRGDLNGIVRERGDLFSELVPVPPPEELRLSFLAKLRDQFRLGITSLIPADVSLAEFSEWERLYAQLGNELPRAAVQIQWPGDSALRAFGRITGAGNDRLRLGAIKLYIDGGFTGPAAYTVEPYRGQPNYRGKLVRPEEEVYRIVKAGHAMGWQFGVHTIGDGAIAMAVEVFDRVLRENPRPDHRHYLNHFSMLPPRQTLMTMAKDSLLIAQQPNFTYTIEGRYAAYLDGRRLQHNNPIATPIRAGIFMAFGSDIMPIGPMVGLYAAVTRKGVSGKVYGPDERVSMRDAIRMYTRSGAYLTHEEGTKGTLEPGRLADVIVLDHDLLTVPAAKILTTRVDLTILGGKVVYERQP